MTWAISLSIIALVALSGGAYAITGNFQPDTTPYVGIVVLFGADHSPIDYCSGVLISPTVVLTAGHSTLNAVTASVCFDKGPIKYSIVEGKIVYFGDEKIYNSRTLITYPEYIDIHDSGELEGNQIFSKSDIGLVILDSPVSEINEFPSLPEAGLADTLEARTYLKEIGYGVQYQTTPRNVGVQNSWTGTISRNSALAQLIPGNFAGSDKYLRLTANPSQDKGGIAFGDSGGPVLYQAGDGTCIVLAINAFVSNSNCAGVSYHTRIDTEQVLGWIQEKIADNSGGENL